MYITLVPKMQKSRPQLRLHASILRLSLLISRERENIHPGRLTWNLQITHLERKMIFHTSIIMFHVNLQGCIPRLGKSVASHRLNVESKGANLLPGGLDSQDPSGLGFLGVSEYL